MLPGVGRLIAAAAAGAGLGAGAALLRRRSDRAHGSSDTSFSPPEAATPDADCVSATHGAQHEEIAALTQSVIDLEAARDRLRTRAAQIRAEIDDPSAQP